jgi:aryl-phospho-beta-D-glucosidase BglC (GH1 family)
MNGLYLSLWLVIPLVEVSANWKTITKPSLYVSFRFHSTDASPFLSRHAQTEQDFAQIAGAGLNHVRIPLGYWAIEVWDGEPFLPKTSWTCVSLSISLFSFSWFPRYFLKAIEWARKYGIRINLDFHALPGSQNGWNHSGKLGTINLINGPMGYANAQRSLDYIRVLAEFVSQPQYKDVVTMFGPVNEPQSPVFGRDNLSRLWVSLNDLAIDHFSCAFIQATFKRTITFVKLVVQELETVP